MPHLWALVREGVGRDHPDLATLGDAIFPRYPELLQVAAMRTPCVVHGDFKAANLRIADREDPSRGLVVLDFQLVFRGLGAHDVARLMADSPAEPGDVDEHRRVCEVWRSALVARGVSDYEPEDAWFDYQLGLSLALRVGATADLVHWTNERNRETAARVVDRVCQAALACHSVDFVRQVVAQ